MKIIKQKGIIKEEQVEKIIDWISIWANWEEHHEKGNHYLTEFDRGYHKACEDIHKKICESVS